MEADTKFREVIDRIHAKSEKNVGPHLCTIWKGATTDKNKLPIYGTMRNPFKKEKPRIHTHRLMYMATKGLEDLNQTGPDGRLLEVSHLCHTPVCVNFTHLTLETHEKNMERRHCKDQGLCSKNHMPYCLL